MNNHYILSSIKKERKNRSKAENKLLLAINHRVPLYLSEVFYFLLVSINACTGLRLYGLLYSIAVSTVPPPVKK